MPSTSYANAARRLIPAMFFAVLAIGCGDGPPVEPVSGMVTARGKPVTGGSVTFVPRSDGSLNPGRPASAVVQKDGTYQLGTHSADDGAVVGKHAISYSAPILPFPEGRDPPQGASPPPSGFEGLTVRQFEVEVKSGQNTIDIELVPVKK